MSGRAIRMVVHGGRDEALRAAAKSIRLFAAAGVEVVVSAVEAADLRAYDAELTVAVAEAETDTAGCELVVVLGGDGTILRGAELARPDRTPVLGVNLGHVGFLAESEPEDLLATVDAVITRRYTVEERLTIDVTVERGGEIVASEWALNEASLEKAARERMIELIVEVDGRPLSRWATDGVVAATPTGSTAYAFSAGGPIVWPQVEALVLVPISAHALFARPLVISPESTLAFELTDLGQNGVLWCDGRRMVDLRTGDRVEVRRGALPVRLARLHSAPFADRLVNKFNLPVHGWRGAGRGSDGPVGADA